MKVRELMAALAALDPDGDVRIGAQADDYTDLALRIIGVEQWRAAWSEPHGEDERVDDAQDDARSVVVIRPAIG